MIDDFDPIAGTNAAVEAFKETIASAEEPPVDPRRCVCKACGESVKLMLMRGPKGGYVTIGRGALTLGGLTKDVLVVCNEHFHKVIRDKENTERWVALTKKQFGWTAHAHGMTLRTLKKKLVRSRDQEVRKREKKRDLHTRYAYVRPLPSWVGSVLGGWLMGPLVAGLVYQLHKKKAA